MRRDVILIGFVGAVFVLAALLAPPVFMLAQALAARLPAFASLADHPFPRYVSRILMILAVLGLYPLVRALRATPHEVGITRPAWKDLGKGVVLAMVALGAFVLVAFAADARSWRPNVSNGRIYKAVLMAFGTAMVVAPLEELVFRGVLFGLLRRARRWLPALAISSLVFGVVHFLQRPAEAETVSWFSGFSVLGGMFVPDTANALWVTQLINLTLCGAILAWAYQRTGTLWFSIGLHAGWIFWLKVANSVTRVTAADAPIWGTRKLVDGWGATVALVITALLIPWLTRNQRAKP